MTSAVAIISDIHGNLQALNAVLARIDNFECDSIYCLGDIIGYGARPAECIELLRERQIECLMGNHDALVCGVDDGAGFNILALESGRYAKEQLNGDQIDFLRSLPAEIHPASRALMAHGSPGDRNRYLISGYEFKLVVDCMVDTGFDICFIGHTHLPCVYSGDELLFYKSETAPLLPECPAIVNPGSVGQPRDRDNRASFVIWLPEKNSVQFERVSYDIEAARQDIIDAGLPVALGDRLRAGR